MSSGALDKIPLSVPLIVDSLNAGLKQFEIAEMCNITFQAVSDYKTRHSNEISLLLDKTDKMLATKHKLNTLKATEKLSLALDFEPPKKDIIPLVAVIDRLTPAFRLLQGQATAINDNRDIVISLQANIERFLDADKPTKNVTKVDNNSK